MRWVEESKTGHVELVRAREAAVQEHVLPRDDAAAAAEALGLGSARRAVDRREAAAEIAAKSAAFDPNKGG